MFSYGKCKVATSYIQTIYFVVVTKINKTLNYTLSSVNFHNAVYFCNKPKARKEPYGT